MSRDHALSCRDTLTGATAALSALAVARAECAVFRHHDIHHARRCALALEASRDAREDEAREILTGWYELPLAEFRDVDVDVPMVESLLHLFVQDAIEDGEIDDHSGHLVDLSADGDIARIAVSVIARPRAETEDGLVLLVRPRGNAIAMRGSERDTTREEGWHGAKMNRGRGNPQPLPATVNRQPSTVLMVLS